MKIIVFDTETTGLPIREGILAKQPHVIQFASITYDYNPATRHFAEIKRYDQLIKPPIAIPADATRISGITDEKVANMPVFSLVCQEIQGLFAEADIAIAHNLEFDKLMLTFELQRLNMPLAILPAETYDSMEKTRDLCKLPGRGMGYKAPRLMELHQFLLGESFKEAHNALKDVEALARCVKVLLQQGFYQPNPSVRSETINYAEQATLF